jgi:hypothetical protein
MTEFRLTRDELARQLHQTLTDLYPERNFDASIIHQMIVDMKSDGSYYIFPAAHFAEFSGMESSGFVDSLQEELGIEYEKNLHDKFLFDMTREEGNLIFKAVTGQSNVKR